MMKPLRCCRGFVVCNIELKFGLNVFECPSRLHHTTPCRRTSVIIVRSVRRRRRRRHRRRRCRSCVFAIRRMFHLQICKWEVGAE
jgi:hypothetical protein